MPKFPSGGMPRSTEILQRMANRKATQDMMRENMIRSAQRSSEIASQRLRQKKRLGQVRKGGLLSGRGRIGGAVLRKKLASIRQQKEASWLGAGVGAGVGALGGAMAGGPDNRLGGALMGGVLGAGAGAGGHHLWKNYQQTGKLLGKADDAAGATNKLKGSLDYKAPPQPAPTTVAAPNYKIQNTAGTQPSMPTSSDLQMPANLPPPSSPFRVQGADGTLGRVPQPPPGGGSGTIPFTPPTASGTKAAMSPMQRKLASMRYHQQNQVKLAHVHDYAAFAQAVNEGAFGKNAQAALMGIAEVQQEARAQYQMKQASDPFNPQTSPLYARPEEARQYRLNTLLRRY